MNIKPLSILLWALAALTWHPQSEAVTPITGYTYYVDKTENIKSAGSTPHVLYSAKVNKLKPGDLVLITAQYEVTGEANAGVGHLLMTGSTPHVVKPVKNAAIKLLPAVMTNVSSKDGHHLIGTVAKQWVVPDGLKYGPKGEIYINLVLYTVMNSVKVERGYGLLEVTVLRAAR